MRKLALLTFFVIFGCGVMLAQTGTESGSKVQRVAERAMEIRRMVIHDKSIDHVVVNGKEYKWFADREAAVSYFKNMALKRDMIIVYIDSADPNPAEPDIVTISEPVIRRTE